MSRGVVITVTMIGIKTQNKPSRTNTVQITIYTCRERAPKWASTKIAVPFNCLPLIITITEDSQKWLLIKISKQSGTPPSDFEEYRIKFNKRPDPIINHCYRIRRRKMSETRCNISSMIIKFESVPKKYDNYPGCIITSRGRAALTQRGERECESTRHGGLSLGSGTDSEMVTRFMMDRPVA
jgi:hypothetical protein